jgi:hypothetical protein
MNNTQRMYDFGFSIVIGAKKLNPFSYFRSIQLINGRKTQYPSFDRFKIKTISSIPYKNIFVIETNKKMKNKVRDIIKKPCAPKINNSYLKLQQIIRNNREKIQEKNKRALTIENVKYNWRIQNQKPKILKANYLNKLFIENHDKYLELLLRNSRFRKKGNSSNIIKSRYIKLPNISGYKDGMFSKMHSKTEFNLDENDNSKDNSVEQKDHKHKEISHQKQGLDDKQNY